MSPNSVKSELHRKQRRIQRSADCAARDWYATMHLWAWQVSLPCLGCRRKSEQRHKMVLRRAHRTAQVL